MSYFIESNEEVVVRPVRSIDAPLVDSGQNLANARPHSSRGEKVVPQIDVFIEAVPVGFVSGRDGRVASVFALIELKVYLSLGLFYTLTIIDSWPQSEVACRRHRGQKRPS